MCVFVWLRISSLRIKLAAKICTVVHQRTGQVMSHFCELCSPRRPKSDESASVWRMMNVPVGDSMAWCGYIRSGSVWCFKAVVTHMPIKFARRVDVGSARVDVRQSPKMDVLVIVVVVGVTGCWSSCTGQLQFSSLWLVCRPSSGHIALCTTLILLILWVCHTHTHTHIKCRCSIFVTVSH